MSIQVITSTDREGDGCLCIRRDREDWLTEDQLSDIAEYLQEQLNTGVVSVPDALVQCADCEEKMNPDDAYQTDCGDFCSDCINSHAKGCSDCCDRYDLGVCPECRAAEEEDDEPDEEDELEPELESEPTTATSILDTSYRQPSAADRFFA